MKTLIERRDELSKKHCDEVFKQNPKGYSVMPGMNEPDTDFEMGFDAATDIWREETKALVEALERYQHQHFESCTIGYNSECDCELPNRAVEALEALEAFKAKGLL